MSTQRGVKIETWTRSLLVAVLLVFSGAPAAPARAATEVLYVAATGHYMRGVFRDFWDRNGGLPNFGYPITEEYIDPGTGRVYQYYERARFERANPASTTVQLGLLGRAFLGSRSFERVQPIPNTRQRRYFPETGHSVQYGFKEIWETRGGLPIFGLPLSEELQEQLADGQVRTVQYFERVRFEYWPNLPPGRRVVISDLGRQLAPRELMAPLAPNAPPPGPITITPPAPPPALARPIVPESKNARVVPLAGQPGQTFTFEATGYQPGEPVAIWMNVPDGTVLASDLRVTADAKGTIAGIEFQSDEAAPLGVWSIVAQGTESGHGAVGYFRLLGSAIGRAPAPGPGVPPNVDARADPAAGPAGTIFFFDAFGFRPGEEVELTIVASDGRRFDADFTVQADQAGAIGYAGLFYATAPGDPLGLYSFIARGRSSGKTSTAYFVLTP